MSQRSLLPLLISLIGVSVCAAACFVMLAPYQAYRWAAGRSRWLQQNVPRPAPQAEVERARPRHVGARV
jgi:hypothetical protein